MYAIPGKVGISRSKSNQTDPILNDLKGVIVSQKMDIRFAKFAITLNVSPLYSSDNTRRTDSDL